MPFQQFRMWLGRASVSERGMTAIAAVVAVALLSWLLAPATPPGSTSGGFNALDSLSGAKASTGGTASSPTGRRGTPASGSPGA